jgi:GTP-binding protein
VGTKTDLEAAGERLEELAAKYPQEKVLGISVFSGEGIKELAASFLELTQIPQYEDDREGKL